MPTQLFENCNDVQSGNLLNTPGIVENDMSTFELEINEHIKTAEIDILKHLPLVGTGFSRKSMLLTLR